MNSGIYLRGVVRGDELGDILLIFVLTGVISFEDVEVGLVQW